MKKRTLMLAVVLALCGWAMAQADQKKTVTSVMDGTVKTIESELVPAVEAMPEDKFGFAPTNGEFKGVRTFAQQAKHIAAVNYIVAAAILEEKPACRHRRRERAGCRQDEGGYRQIPEGLVCVRTQGGGDD